MIRTYHRRMKAILRACVPVFSRSMAVASIVTAALPFLSSAQTINVDFNASDGASGTYSGTAAAPVYGTLWNGFAVGPMNAGVGKITSERLVTSTGEPTDVTVSLSNVFVRERANPTVLAPALLADYVSPSGTGGFSINHLDPWALYDLYVYTVPGGAANFSSITKFTVTNMTLFSSTGSSGGRDIPPFQERDNYLLFQNLTPDESGTIAGVFAPGQARVSANFNGLQLLRYGSNGMPRVTSIFGRHTVLAGTPLTIHATVTGREPLTYEWSKDGTPLPDQTAAQLQLESPGPRDNGIYKLRVSNPLGSATSGEATVTIRSPEDAIDLPDAQLERVVRSALAKFDGILTAADMATLTNLNAQYAGIQSVVGLETAMNMTELHLGGNPAVDFSALASMSHLQLLDLDGDQPQLVGRVLLPTIGSLKSLTLRNGMVQRLTLPGGLTNLISLDLSGNYLLLFNLPDDLHRLSRLTIDNNLLQYWSLNVPALESLAYLSLQNSHLRMVALSPGLDGLEDLRLEYNELTSLTLPATAKRLRRLSVSGNPLLATMLLPPDIAHLEELHANSTALTSLSLTADPSSIRSISLDYSPISELHLPSTVDSLESLNLQGTKITSLQVPQGAKLKNLNVDGTPIVSLSIPGGTEANPSVSDLRAAGVDVTITANVQLPPAENRIRGDLLVFGDLGWYDILRSTDLESWLKIGAVRLDVPNLPGAPFSDAAAAGFNAVFYKVFQPTQLVQEPEPTTLYAGATLTLTTRAAGSGPLLYQWYHGSIPLDGGTNAILTVANAKTSDSGEYRLLITGPQESISSRTVAVIIQELPDNAILVLNTLDAGAGSLRQAISEANTRPGTNVILFQISSPLPVAIRPHSPLPEITDSVVIDGTTQPGYHGSPVLELRGDQAGPGASGLILRASSVIRGLVINAWQGNGIELEGTGEHVIQGNYIGLDRAGSAAVANGGAGILVTRAGKNRVGGVTKFDANVISGNVLSGIEMTDGATGNLITGNFIGTDARGNAAIPNGAAGVLISSASNNQVGGDKSGEGNVISGNGQSGVNLTLNGSLSPAQPTSGNVIQGNRIGVSADGASALPNVGSGILVSGGCSKTLVGGSNSLSGNTISGNINNGIEIVGNASDSSVFGNRIGTDPSGTLKLPNNLDGILISGAGTGLFPVRTIVGSTSAGGANVISGNNYSGIEIDGRGTGTQIRGNFIGTDASGTAPLGNIFAGIYVSQEESATTAGTAQLSITDNVIAFNLEAGVDVQDKRSPGNPYNTGILIRRNSIFSNTLLGIDLQPTGRTANDTGDTDLGANGLQNTPVLTNIVASVGGTLSIQGTLNSRPNLTYTIDLYANAECEADGYGEGQTWLASVSVRTDGTGNAVFSAGGVILPAGQPWITATATDPSQNTSEFSACKAATP